MSPIFRQAARAAERGESSSSSRAGLHPLVEAGDAITTSASVGRPAPDTSTRTSLWGIDLGGTKMEGVILDPAQPDRPILRLRMPTQSERGYEHIVERLCALVEEMETRSEVLRPAVIGIGTPGAVEPATGLMKNCNTTCLNGRPLPRDLATALRTEVRVANDANCFAVAEATLGAGRGCAVVVGLIIGSGVGSGIVVHGRMLEGRHGIAGEWGHNPICGEDAPCYCGRRGCVETVIAGPSLERFYRERTGDSLSLPEIVRRAGGGEPAARATIERLQSRFGLAIAALINIVDPDVIVIGGGVGNIDALYTEETRRAALRHLFNPELRTTFSKPVLGDSAGVFGAALLAR
jgi:predicted NBD/HSP70 family sugar kinase